MCWRRNSTCAATPCWPEHRRRPRAPQSIDPTALSSQLFRSNDAKPAPASRSRSTRSLPTRSTRAGSSSRPRVITSPSANSAPGPRPFRRSGSNRAMWQFQHIWRAHASRCPVTRNSSRDGGLRKPETPSRPGTASRIHCDGKITDTIQDDQRLKGEDIWADFDAGTVDSHEMVIEDAVRADHPRCSAEPSMLLR